MWIAPLVSSLSENLPQHLDPFSLHLPTVIHCPSNNMFSQFILARTDNDRTDSDSPFPEAPAAGLTRGAHEKPLLLSHHTLQAASMITPLKRHYINVKQQMSPI
ncbi:hypothetical protein CHARACLAT_024961 [Characodon lateralis]|uniref:Uncharacterized protein n=1 Tax=Characodon lateralis TaxID=208331 RepID=A0ABU7ENB2_9TELE|nr:hypothetical protein [Characodon lateralis]